MTYIRLSYQHHNGPAPPRNHLRHIRQLDGLPAPFREADAQRFEHIGVEAPAGLQLRQLLVQPLQRAVDPRFEGGEVVRVVVRGFEAGGGLLDGTLRFISLAFLEQEGCGGEESRRGGSLGWDRTEWSEIGLALAVELGFKDATAVREGSLSVSYT